MQPDEARAAEVREWLRRAALDLRAAEHDLLADPPLLEDSLFHCQQVAEKAEKALLQWHDVAFRKTHDLAEIGRQCAELDASLTALLERAASLSDYAWEFRYPGDAEEPTPDEVQAALALAGRVYEAVVQRLPPEARP